jgi:hypothetical protein
MDDLVSGHVQGTEYSPTQRNFPVVVMRKFMKHKNELYGSYFHVVKTGTSLILKLLLLITSCEYINRQKI